MAEIPKTVSVSCLGVLSEVSAYAGESVLTNIAVWEQNEVSFGKTDLSDSFLVDIENLSPNTIIDKPSASSVISVKLQRNLSRKGSPRGERNRSTLVASSGLTDGSTKGIATEQGCDDDKSTTEPMATLGMKETLNRQTQQAIIMAAENRSNSGKYLKRRTSFIDPKRVLFFFATLSSMGTMVLIYYTLSVRKFSGDNSTHVQQ